MKRLFVLGMLLWAPAVWAQCQPTNSPTVDASNSKVVAPNKVPFAAVTVNANGSHKITAGAGFNMTIGWQSYNAASVSAYYTVDNGPKTNWYSVNSLSGSAPFGLLSSWIGHVIRLYAVATEKPGSGSFTPTTQDVDTITVTGDPPGTYAHDGLSSNAYAMVNMNYSGTPNIPYQTTCPNAAEKDMVPTAQLQLSNVTSGENRNGTSFQGATTVVGQPVSATAYDYISFLPGDVITPTASGFVYCSAIGDFWQLSEAIGAEYAVTYVVLRNNTCALKVRTINGVDEIGIQCNVGWNNPNTCSNASSPPDFQPAAIWSSELCETPGECTAAEIPTFTAEHPNWYAASLGFRVPNFYIEGEYQNGWHFPLYDLLGYVPGVPNEDFWLIELANLAIPKGTSISIDCTNYDKGTSPIPWPF